MQAVKTLLKRTMGLKAPYPVEAQSSTPAAVTGISLAEAMLSGPGLIFDRTGRNQALPNNYLT